MTCLSVSFHYSFQIGHQDRAVKVETRGQVGNGLEKRLTENTAAGRGVIGPENVLGGRVGGRQVEDGYGVGIERHAASPPLCTAHSPA